MSKRSRDGGRVAKQAGKNNQNFPKQNFPKQGAGRGIDDTSPSWGSLLAV